MALRVFNHRWSPRKRFKFRLYPWVEWTDGYVWEIIKGDYGINSLYQFTSQLRTRAHIMGLKVRYEIVSGKLYFQFYQNESVPCQKT
jgi:hypothetical protein